jgi:hypothetical protein
MMRSYQLYLIEEEFASHFFGREQVFYKLFLEKERAQGELKTIIESQIHYITKPLSSLRIHKMIIQKLSKYKDFRSENGVYYIERNGLVGSARLEIFERVVTIDATGSFDTETIFFEALRQCESSFLAIDLKHERYGWLNPIKERKFV